MRNKSLFDPTSPLPYSVSRSGLDLFLECPRCFYLAKRLGVGRPPGFPFSLNNCVDTLLKKEFDLYRRQGSPHPLMLKHGIDAVPFAHPAVEVWRDALRRGIQFLHEPTNINLRGGIDDVWIKPSGELILVDYKATSKRDPVSLDADWQISYKRQMEVYQWLFRMNGFTVSPTGYFVYCNGNSGLEAFNSRIEFEISVLAYDGDTTWIEPALTALKACLVSDSLPRPSAACAYCRYCKAVQLGAVCQMMPPR